MAAYDMVRLSRELDLNDPQAIADHLNAITICEVKATNRKDVGEDLSGYFFNITGPELVSAQSLKQAYRFVFVHVLTGAIAERSLAEVLGASRGIYPSWHIRF